MKEIILPTWVMTILVVLAGTIFGCDNAVPLEEVSGSLDFPEDSPARYVGQLAVTADSPEIQGEGDETTYVYTFRKDVPMEPIPASHGTPTFEGVPPEGDTSEPPLVGRGPLCIYGDPYRAFVQRADSPDNANLVLHLGGGGVCFVSAKGPGDCLVTNDTSPNVWPSSPSSFPFLLSDPSLNPYTNDWNKVYMPYCDNSLYSGDVNAFPVPGQTKPRYYRGAQNFSAGLQLAYQLNPNPDKILLAGALGGGYGAVVNTPAVMEVFPDADIYVYSQSGMLMANRYECRECSETCPAEGTDPCVECPEGKTEICGQNLNLLSQSVEEFNATAYVPSSCSNCLANGTLWRAAASVVNKSKNSSRTVKVSLVTTVENTVISEVFMRYLNNLLGCFVDSFINAFVEFQTNTPDGYRAGYLIEGEQQLSGIVADQEGETLFDIRIEDPTIEHCELIMENCDPTMGDCSCDDPTIEHCEPIMENCDPTMEDCSCDVLLGDWIEQFLTDDPAWSTVSSPSISVETRELMEQCLPLPDELNTP